LSLATQLPSSTAQTRPLRQLLSFPVVISVSNYVLLAFLNISATALLPLFLHMPLTMGGLALEPHQIGYIMGVYGGGTGLIQMVFFARVVRRFGVRSIFVWSTSSFIPMFLIFPVISTITKHQGISALVWGLIGVIVACLLVMDTAYGM
jgi:MFS family permease